MNPWEQALLRPLHFNAVLPFILWTLVLSFALRVILFALREVDSPNKPVPRPFWRLVLWKSFLTWQHLHPSVLGTLELLAYPVLMAHQAWAVIGAWLAFKALAQWDRWKSERALFNVFLIGNALVIMASYMILLRYVSY